MPRSRVDRLIFTTVVVVALLMLGFMARNAMQEQALSRAVAAGDDPAAFRLLKAGVFAGHARRLQEISDSAFINNCPQAVAFLLGKEIFPRGTSVPAMVEAPECCPYATGPLLEHGANIETRDETGRTALMAAVSRGRADIVRLLLDRHANLNAQDREGDTPLIYSLMDRPHADIARLLVTRGANVKTIDRHGATPLAWAARRGELSLIKMLLARGADVNVEPAPLRRGGFQIAGSSPGPGPVGLRGDGRVEVGGGAIVVRGGALAEAVRGLHQDALEQLLQSGAGPEARSHALVPAVRLGQPEMVRLLLAKGARPEAGDSAWLLAINAARIRGDERVLGLLRPLGVTAERTPAEREIRNSMHQTPLLFALASGNSAAAQRLIKEGADINATDLFARTPLMEAAEHCPDLVLELLAKGAGPNVMSLMGDYPLKGAVLSGNVKVVNELLKHGADANLRVTRHHTALFYAKRHNRNEIVATLIQAGGQDE